MKRDIKLYNVMFPLWMFFLLPTVVWLIILPVNFAVDTLVVLLVLGRLGFENRRELWKKSIVRVWLFGFLADFIGGKGVVSCHPFGDMGKLHLAADFRAGT